MAIIQSSPNQHSPVYNCLKWGVFTDSIAIINGDYAGFTVTFDSGGTATDGTIVTIAGVKFIKNDVFGINDGTYFTWDGLTDIERATNFYNNLLQNINFPPDLVSILQLGNAVGVTYNLAGLQPDWTFNNGGITEISFFESNGVNYGTSDLSYVHGIFEDRSASSTFPLRLTSNKITPITFTLDDTLAYPQEQTIILDYSTDLRKFLSTSLPNIYTAALSPYLDPLYSKKVFLWVGAVKRSNCDNIPIWFENSDSITIYNALFQNIDNIGQDLLEPYIFNGKPFLIKNTYEICTNQSFYVWAHSGTSPSIVYYDANNAPIESGSFDIDTEGVNVINCGTDVLDVPSNCAYYVIVFGNDEQFPIRFNIVGCGCKEAEVLFLSDLGAYEVRTFDQLDIIELSTNSDLTEGNEGCDAIGLITNGKSVVNTETQKQYTFSTWLDNSEQEIEFAEQFKRSQSIHIKTFVPAADAYMWQKVVPLSINFNREFGKRPRLSFTYIPNLNEASHEQNNSYSSI